MAQPPPQLLGIIPAGHPVLTVPTSTPTPTSLLYTLPATPTSYAHITVFLLPGVTLPPETGVAVYLQLPSPATNNNAPEFRFLGAIGPGKESATFRVRGLGGASASASPGAAGDVGAMEMDDGNSNTNGVTAGGTPEVHIGVSLESAADVAAKLSTLPSTSAIPNTTTSATGSNSNNNNSSALIPFSRGPPKPDTTVLAQRIIKNAFNFLASFSGNTSGGVEVVPLKAFEEWWRKFEGRVRSDPGFLERDGD